MRIAFLATANPEDRRAGSGSLYSMLRALQQQGHEIICMNPIGPGTSLIGRFLRFGTRLLTRCNYSYQHNLWLARRWAAVIDRRLTRQPCDLIVAPFATVITAFLRTPIPTALIEDATFAQLHNYYPAYTDMLVRSLEEAEVLTARAFTRAQWLIFSSQWAASSAVEAYHISAEKVHVVPFGANIENVPTVEEIAGWEERSPVCRLLLVGVDWQRKGGDTAVAALECLRAMGIEAELTICGCAPPQAPTVEGLTIIPFLNKNDAHDRAELHRLYMRSDFLLAPSRADCTPCALCEAAAYGLPILAADTGAISEMVHEGENGVLLPVDASGAAYAEVIAEILSNKLRYAALSEASRTAFERRFNWDAWGQAVHHMLVPSYLRKSVFPYNAVIQDSRRRTRHIAESV